MKIPERKGYKTGIGEQGFVKESVSYISVLDGQGLFAKGSSHFIH